MPQPDKQITASVSEPTKIPERPTLYILIVPAEDEWRIRLYSSSPEILAHMDKIKTPGSFIVTIPAPTPPTKPESVAGDCHICHGDPEARQFCSQCKPASPRICTCGHVYANHAESLDNGHGCCVAHCSCFKYDPPASPPQSELNTPLDTGRYIVAKVKATTYGFSPNPKVHQSHGDALAEAHRLTEKERTAFAVFKESLTTQQSGESGEWVPEGMNTPHEWCEGDDPTDWVVIERCLGDRDAQWRSALTKQREEVERWKRIAHDLHVAYINKDPDCPHKFETDAVAAYLALKSQPQERVK